MSSSARSVGSLPDINVLLALVWPRHNGHTAAQLWFAEAGHRSWATSPLTQLGVLRLLTNPAITRGAVDARSAIAALRKATQHSGHEFWPMELEIVAALEPLAPAIPRTQAMDGCCIAVAGIAPGWRAGDLRLGNSGARRQGRKPSRADPETMIRETTIRQDGGRAFYLPNPR